ncbi:MAG: RagB/SusD family nutrient uptake outer membrane protein [Prevotella sp.]|nr:RagB/SusD family nutrient uptake outer membrane protein [Prevotella sp.]
MKRKNIAIILGCAVALTSCSDLDLNPLANGSTESWYQDEAEIEMAVNDLYQNIYWEQDGGEYTDWSDDYQNRGTLREFENATLNGQLADVTDRWDNWYKMIAHANGVIAKADRAIANGANKSKIDVLVGEAYFGRAHAYSELVFKFGDVPMITSDLSIEEAYQTGRTDKATIQQLIYDDFDKAIAVLPQTNSGKQRATKGAALALKARIALYLGDWATASTAAKACMDLGQYKLHEKYSDLFYQKTKESNEFIFIRPRAIEHDDFIRDAITRNHFPRNTQGFCAIYPTWDLFAAYTCTDGLPIDKSPLFDPHNPFDNRDPRCSMTIVPFGTNHLGVEFNPRPDVNYVMDYDKGKKIWNNDTRVNHENATWNGLIWRKGIDKTWFDNGYKIAPPRIISRYADVLLTYAEAKIEMNQIDQSVLDAMNMVRARAYGVDKSETDKYPAFTSTNQNTLRHQLRIERRMEFPMERLRYADIIRWRLAEKVMSNKIYGLNFQKGVQPTEQQLADWFWAETPKLDEDGVADFTKMEAEGKIVSLAQRRWDNRQYLWPIPTAEVVINTNMKQNPGY